MGHYYYVSKHSGYNNNHVVHAAGCQYLPPLDARLFLGTFYTANAAIQQARKYYPGSLGCEACCPLPVKKNLTQQNSVALKHIATL
ncbi:MULTISPECIES: hypothetical protein [Pantoea]|jgi:hypothetical protein|uniref:Uncharacterized protein n=1 Tax=Pantoea latae TaxID=1964541 RepID=A0A1V9DMY4_9GAMM|nr:MULTISPECIES: hypothetical protein [Pantoea]OQP35206.1 hypothetical protein B2J69_06775 [Pantoea latae]